MSATSFVARQLERSREIRRSLCGDDLPLESDESGGRKFELLKHSPASGGAQHPVKAVTQSGSAHPRGHAEQDESVISPPRRTCGFGLSAEKDEPIAPHLATATAAPASAGTNTNADARVAASAQGVSSSSASCRGTRRHEVELPPTLWSDHGVVGEVAAIASSNRSKQKRKNKQRRDTSWPAWDDDEWHKRTKAAVVVQRRVRKRFDTMKKRILGIPQQRSFRSLVNEATNHAQALCFGSLSVHLFTNVNGSVLGARTLIGSPTSPRTQPGGTGLNQAAALAQLDVTAYLVGLVGQDALSGVVHNYLEMVARHSALLIDGVKKKTRAATGMELVILGDDSEQITTHCAGANLLVGEQEAQRAIALLTEKPIAALLLSLEIPLPMSSKVATAAWAHGCRFVALRSSPLAAWQVDAVRSMLRGGLVSVLFATPKEANLLLKLVEPVRCVFEVERIARHLLDEFDDLSTVIIFCDGNVVIRYRGDGQNGKVGRAECTDVQLFLPLRRMEHVHMESLAGSAGEGDEWDSPAASVVGAIDAFCGGVAAAQCHRLSVEQAVLWGYAAGQLCQLKPGSQLDGDRRDLKSVLELELRDESLVDSITRIPDGTATLPVAALEASTFLRLNRLHLVAQRSKPSALPFLVTGSKSTPQLKDGSAADQDMITPAQTDASAVRARMAEVGRLLVEVDALGYTPLQRANEAFDQTSKDTIQRLLCHRILDWFLSAHALLTVSEDIGPAYNPLLEHNAMHVKPSVGVEKPPLFATRSSGNAFCPGEVWRHVVCTPPSNQRIFQDRLKLIEQIDDGSCPSNVQDASCRLATNVIMSILDDVGRRRQARNSAGSSTLRACEQTELQLHTEKYRGDLNAADAAELQLVEAVCLSELRNGTADLKAEAEHGVVTPSMMWERLTPFCGALLRCRDPAEGRTLLLLAAGAGMAVLVEVLLDFCSLGLLHENATSFLGSTALHEAAAAEDEATCQVLLRRTHLPLRGATATNRAGRMPLTGCTGRFCKMLLAVRPNVSVLLCGFLPSGALLGTQATATAELIASALQRRLGENHPVLHTAQIASMDEFRRAMQTCEALFVLISPALLKHPRCYRAPHAAIPRCPLLMRDLSLVVGLYWRLRQPTTLARKSLVFSSSQASARRMAVTWEPSRSCCERFRTLTIQPRRRPG